MALKFFESEESSTTGSLEFLNDWLIENPKNKKKEFLIVECKRAKSNKGFIVSTTDFNVFLWKNSKIAKMLMEAFDHYVNKSKYGYELYVVLKNPTKAEFQIAADEETKITWFTMGNGFTTIEENVSLPEDTDQAINPLIPPIP